MQRSRSAPVRQAGQRSAAPAEDGTAPISLIELEDLARSRYVPVFEGREERERGASRRPGGFLERAEP